MGTTAKGLAHHQANAHATETMVGAIVWADAELGSAKYRRSEVRATLLANGLDPDLQPTDPTPQAAFGKALQRVELPDGWKIERSEPRSRTALLFRISGKGTTRIDRAEVQLTAGDAGIQTTPHRALLTVEQRDALAPLDSLYSENLEFLAAHEVQDLLRAALKTWDATRIRPHSGTFFVPARAIDAARRLSRTLESLGGTRVVVLPLYDGQSKIISDDLADGLERERRGVLLGLQHTIEGHEKVRPSTIQSRIDELNELEARVGIVREVLGRRAHELTTRLAAARAHLRKSVDGEAIDWTALLAEV